MLYFTNILLPSLAPLEWLDPRILIPCIGGDETLFLCNDLDERCVFHSADRLATRGWLIETAKLKRNRQHYEICTSGSHGRHCFSMEQLFINPRQKEVGVKIEVSAIVDKIIKCVDTIAILGKPTTDEIEIVWGHSDSVCTQNAGNQHQSIFHFKRLHQRHTRLCRLIKLKATPSVTEVDMKNVDEDLTVLGSLIPAIMPTREELRSDPLNFCLESVKQHVLGFISPRLRAQIENLAVEHWANEVLLDSTKISMRFCRKENVNGAVVTTQYCTKNNHRRCDEHESMINRLIENAQPELLADTHGQETRYELPLITDSGCIKLAGDADDMLAVLNHQLRVFLPYQDKIDRVFRLYRGKDSYPLGTIRRK